MHDWSRGTPIWQKSGVKLKKRKQMVQGCCACTTHDGDFANPDAG